MVVCVSCSVEPKAAAVFLCRAVLLDTVLIYGMYQFLWLSSVDSRILYQLIYSAHFPAAHHPQSFAGKVQINEAPTDGTSTPLHVFYRVFARRGDWCTYDGL